MYMKISSLLSDGRPNTVYIKGNEICDRKRNKTVRKKQSEKENAWTRKHSSALSPNEIKERKNRIYS